MSRLSRALQRLAGLQNWEATRERGGMRATDASGCRAVCLALGWPQGRLECVHIAGSKGKGTVGALVGAALGAAGLRTAVLSSPHVASVTERVRLGPSLAEIDETALAEALEASGAAAGRLPAGTASYFDALVAGSLEAARRARCRWAVVECGLGGRRDSTNVVNAGVAALTSVELEHTEVLGDRVSQIATEKAAIASRGGWLVTGRMPFEAFRAAKRTASRRGARVVRVKMPRQLTDFEPSNLAVAKKILDLLGRRGARTRRGRPVSGKLLRDSRVLAVARRALPARREFYDHNLLIDGAHTPDSVRALGTFLRRRNDRGVVALVGLAVDKDPRRFARAVHAFLAPASAVVVPLDDTDAARRQAAQLAQLLDRATIQSTVSDGLRLARLAARRHDGLVAAFGSFTLCSRVRNLAAEPLHASHHPPES